MKKLNTRIAVCVPLYGVIPVASFASIAGTIAVLPQQTEKAYFFYKTNTGLYFSRTGLLENALQAEQKNGLDYIIWLDQDMVFSTDQVMQLVESAQESNADLISGLYFTKEPPFHPIFYMDTPQGYGIPAEIPEQKRVSVDAVGFGFLCMRVSAVKQMLKKYKLEQLFANDEEKQGKYLTEDLAFCKKARECGLKIIVDTRIQVGHHGSVITGEVKKAWDALHPE